jgi:hypothetical protein
MISRTRGMSGALPIKIIPIGDWVKTSLFIADLPQMIAIGSAKGQESAANKLYSLIRKNIKNQGVPGGPKWPQLSSEYKKIKASDGYDPNKMLIRTGLYYRSIKVWNKGSNYYVGVKRGVRASGGKKTVGWVAHLLERGSNVRNIKARPLWVPTFKQFGGNRRIKAHIVWHIANIIYLRHGVRVKIY